MAFNCFRKQIFEKRTILQVQRSHLRKLVVRPTGFRIINILTKNLQKTCSGCCSRSCALFLNFFYYYWGRQTGMWSHLNTGWKLFWNSNPSYMREYFAIIIVINMNLVVMKNVIRIGSALLGLCSSCCNFIPVQICINFSLSESRKQTQNTTIFIY